MCSTRMFSHIYRVSSRLFHVYCMKASTVKSAMLLRGFPKPGCKKLCYLCSKIPNGLLDTAPKNQPKRSVACHQGARCRASSLLILVRMVDVWVDVNCCLFTSANQLNLQRYNEQVGIFNEFEFHLYAPVCVRMNLHMT